MRVVRGTVNAVLMMTLVKPIVRLTVRRWRKRAEESAATTMGIPVQELVEAALIEELAPELARLDELDLDGLDEAAEETIEQITGRSAIRTVLIAGIVAAAVAGSAWAITTAVRRRREAQAAAKKDSEWVAVPVEEAAEAVEEADLLEALAE